MGLIEGLKKWLDEVRRYNILTTKSTPKTEDNLPQVAIFLFN
jgi:hypothetical protein